MDQGIIQGRTWKHSNQDAIVWWSAGCAIRKRDLQNLVVLHLSLWNVLAPEWEQMTESTWTYITSNTIKPIVDNIAVSDIASELVRVDKCLCHWDLQNEARPSDWIKGCGSSMIKWESGGAQGDGSICQTCRDTSGSGKSFILFPRMSSSSLVITVWRYHCYAHVIQIRLCQSLWVLLQPVLGSTIVRQTHSRILSGQHGYNI